MVDKLVNSFYWCFTVIIYKIWICCLSNFLSISSFCSLRYSYPFSKLSNIDWDIQWLDLVCLNHFYTNKLSFFRDGIPGIWWTTCWVSFHGCPTSSHPTPIWSFPGRGRPKGSSKQTAARYHRITTQSHAIGTQQHDLGSQYHQKRSERYWFVDFIILDKILHNVDRLRHTMARYCLSQPLLHQ